MKRAALFYDALSEVLRDTEIQNGMIIHTLGKEEIADGEGENFIVVEDESDNTVALPNGLFLKPYTTKIDAKIEIADSLRSSKDNEIKSYITKMITELCDDIASEFVSKRGEDENGPDAV